MPKTHLKRIYISRIDELNDELWYFLFTSEELNARIRRLPRARRNDFTTAAFPRNAFSSRIHIRVSSLPAKQESNKQNSFGLYFSTAYEIGANYIKELFTFLIAINGVGGNGWDDRRTPEQNMRRILGNAGLALPHDRIIRTLTYLRLRRNHFIHLLENPNHGLQQFVATESVNSITDWTTAAGPSSVNFASLADPGQFSQTDTVEFFRMLRIVLIDLDAYISSCLAIPMLVQYKAAELFGHESTRTNLDVRRQRATRVVNAVHRCFGRIITEADCDLAVRTIGVR